MDFKKLAVLMCLTLLVCALALGQQIPDLKVGNYDVQIHAFASQGYAESDDNNFLTMNTSSGSFAMTDFAINASMPLSDKLRIGAQMYDYNVGTLGKWHPSLDWGYLDYRFKDWFGIRAGKVKTVIGLYNDTQDAAFLYTWALMPQSIYPLDLRASSIAHLGGDVYGHLGLKAAGSFDYTAYYGYVPFDKYGGSELAGTSSGFPVGNIAERAGGADLRWATPLSGLTVGGSLMIFGENGFAHYLPADALNVDFWAHGSRDVAVYGDYIHKKWHFNAEFRPTVDLVTSTLSGTTDLTNDAWFVSAAYRVSKHLELGAYNSRIYLQQSHTPQNGDSDHIYDQAITARVDLASFWNVKLEGHFMNGYGDIYSQRGFYLMDNAAGFKPDTNMIIIRTGVNF